MQSVYDVSQVVNQVQAKLEKFGYPKFPINISVVEGMKKQIAGQAFPSQQKIAISYDYLKEHRDQTLKETVPHEVCHLYVTRYFPNYKQGHGPEFRMLMRALGCEGSTYHSMELSSSVKKLKTRYVYESVTSKKVCHLTPVKHRQMLSNPAAWVYGSAKEPLVFTGQVKKFY